MPFYAVGEATAAALAVIAQDCDSPLSPKDIRGGSESGTGEQLAHFILRDLSDMSSRKLLHLAGDKTLDTLPHILLEAGSIELDRLQVYRTEPSPRLDAVLAHIIREGQSGNGTHVLLQSECDDLKWIVR